MPHEVSVSLEHYVTVNDPAHQAGDYCVNFTATAEIEYTPADLSGGMEDGTAADGDCSTPRITEVTVFHYSDDTEDDGAQVTDPDLVKACVDLLDSDDIEDTLWEQYHIEHG